MNNLKKIRQERNMTQFELGIRAGITPTDISRIENDKIFLYPGWLKKLALALGVEPEEIIKEGDEGI